MSYYVWNYLPTGTIRRRVVPACVWCMNCFRTSRIINAYLEFSFLRKCFLRTSCFVLSRFDIVYVRHLFSFLHPSSALACTLKIGGTAIVVSANSKHRFGVDKFEDAIRTCCSSTNNDGVVGGYDDKTYNNTGNNDIDEDDPSSLSATTLSPSPSLLTIASKRIVNTSDTSNDHDNNDFAFEGDEDHDMENTSGFVQGMLLTMYTIVKS